MSKNKSKIGFFVTLLFSLLFCAVGVVAGVVSIRLVFQGELREATFAGLFALAFGTAGFSILVSTWLYRQKALREAEAKAEHPNEPWRWNALWATGRIQSNNKKKMLFFWLFAVLWNAVTSPLLLMLPDHLGKSNKGELFLAMMFPAIGVGLLIWAIVRTLHWWRFGDVIFEMTSFPGVIGGKLQGNIHLKRNFLPPDQYYLRLICVNVVQDEDSTTESILWVDEATFSSGSAPQGPVGRSIPIMITVPYTCIPSSPIETADQIVWRLEIRAETLGRHLSSIFDLPVFKTSESSPEITGQNEQREEPNLRVGPKGTSFNNSPITTYQTKQGEIEFFFPANRTPEIALILTAIIIVLTFVCVAIHYTDAPRFFTIAFSTFDAVFILAAITYWFRTTRVTIDRDRLIVRYRTLGIGLTKKIPADQIVKIQSVRVMESTKKIYYDIKILRKKGRVVVAGDFISSKNEAEWLSKKMMDSLIL
ncbi:MAG TPA: hypothetical protein QF468_06265 [Nitrospinota bacterium]|nr:hypothetical protein [Nitrospinota bacterium]|tara:strand:- start:1048 stop:2481 length:1434 start_codon:yes stop_codon:yes gene_type:complete